MALNAESTFGGAAGKLYPDGNRGPNIEMISKTKGIYEMDFEGLNALIIFQFEKCISAVWCFIPTTQKKNMENGGFFLPSTAIINLSIY